MSALRLVEALGGDGLEVWGHVSEQNSTWSAWTEKSRLLGNDNIYQLTRERGNM